MSLWWTTRDQLDQDQLELIEDLPLQESFLIVGPPGSGKTNVLLRRAQFTRTQDMPNVLVLTFTRSLVEFLRTGCVDAQQRVIFPKACIETMEAWIRSLYRNHATPLPAQPLGPDAYTKWKIALAEGAMTFRKQQRLPKYDALFVDEVQDLYEPEVELLRQWSDVLFFAGDSRQKIFGPTSGLTAVQRIIPPQNHRTLKFHYRLAPKICKMADRLLQATGTQTLRETSHYQGPKPGRIEVNGPWDREAQLKRCADLLKSQIRVYADLIRQGDRIGVIVARKADRDVVWQFLEGDSDLAGKSKIIRANSGSEDDRGYDPAFDPERPIGILTLSACKGIEFRAVHWLFADQSSQLQLEHYYTLVTRAKTSLDISYQGKLPQDIARSYSEPGKPLWS